MSENYERLIKSMWICMACHTKTPMGQLLIRGQFLTWPNCKSPDMHPADGTAHVVEDSHWEVPAKVN